MKSDGKPLRFGMKISLLLLAALLGPSTAFPADTKQQMADDLFARYQSAFAAQQPAQKDTSVEVIMAAKIPRLKKEGKMAALRSVSNLGRVTWKMLNFWGDDTVKKEVIARYMTAEVEASSGKPGPSIGISPDNYNYKYKGLDNKEGRQVHVFELKPKHKRVGLFKGEIWLDPETLLPIRETGRLVKNPSIFIKKMEFTRDYEIREGVAHLKRMESRTDTRVVGRAELDIEYANVQKDQSTSGEATAGASHGN